MVVNSVVDSVVDCSVVEVVLVLVTGITEKKGFSYKYET